MEVRIKKIEELEKLEPALSLYTAEDDYNRLKSSIKENGFLLPVIVSNSEIVDGATRLKIAKELGLTEIPVIEFDGKNINVEELAILLNIARRHLSREQKIALIQKLIEISDEKKKKQNVDNLSTLLENTKPEAHRGVAGKISQIMGVSPTTVKKVKVLSSKPELLEKVKTGEVSLEKAYQAVKEAKKEQEEHYKDIKREERVEREQAELDELKTLKELYAQMREIIFTKANAISYTETAKLTLLAIQIIQTILPVVEKLPPSDLDKLTSQLDQLTQVWQEKKREIIEIVEIY